MCAGESPFTPELDPLPQDTTSERDVFSYWCVLLESVWLDVFSWIAVAGGVRLAFLESGKLLTRYIYLLEERLQE